LAQEFSDASRALAHLGVTEPPPGEAAWWPVHHGPKQDHRFAWAWSRQPGV